MPTSQEIKNWHKKIHERYENYLKTSFYFKDIALRKSFELALNADKQLSKGPFPEPPHQFKSGCRANELAKIFFPSDSENLSPALLTDSLYSHQEKAIRLVCEKQRNAVVATGTASGKTEGFLYPILFDLYQQHLDGKLNEPGVRALILYPMNALANDQRRRLGEICSKLKNAGSDFKPTFGQYIGETLENKTLENKSYRYRQAPERLPNELIYREEMRENPPHILLTNYSMLEYLLIRPQDSELFDNGRGQHWRFIVLDEAHQYRGVKGMEMGMLLRRLKRRLRDGGRKYSFRCIATSATLSSGVGEKDKEAVAGFAKELFGEEFAKDDIIFHEKMENNEDKEPQLFHLFLRALEGAFLVHQDDKDEIRLNRKNDDGKVMPIEIALCRECGQHYYVGRNVEGFLQEANRDLGGELCVEFYLPIPENSGHQSNMRLCRTCGKIGEGKLGCGCGADIEVQRCNPHSEHPDRIKECAVCEYKGAGDPVQEIVHGSDGPNSVIATALHGLLPDDKRKILSFADSRQEAAFFAWYVANSYKQILNRNLILRAIRTGQNSHKKLSLDDLANRLGSVSEEASLFPQSDTREAKKRELLKMIYRELLTDERRISLSGVGLITWSVEIPPQLKLPPLMFNHPWNFSEPEARNFISFLLDNLRIKRAVNLPESAETPNWQDVSPLNRPQQSVCTGVLGGMNNVFAWANLTHATFIKHFLFRLLVKNDLFDKKKQQEKGKELMNAIWDTVRQYSRDADDCDKILVRAGNADFRLNPRWLRAQAASADNVFECSTCATISVYNIRDICIRHRCQGNLKLANAEQLSKNHYRILYEDSAMPIKFVAEEHTAQIDSNTARERQNNFKKGDIHLLSSSTTFEVGVDLGDLETVFMRNVPPEPFNYTQRAGRAGRRDTPGLVLTYCRRNPHDLYHYQDPEKRVLQGATRAPQLHLKNEKIILRHMAAVALSVFFKENNNAARFKKMEDFIGGEWGNPQAANDLLSFCKQNKALGKTLRAIVPTDMHDKTGLINGEWCKKIAGEGSALALAEKAMCEDYQRLNELWEEASNRRDSGTISRLGKRMKTISKEKPLTFLSRKAVIPKYGFPVDVVELDVRMSGRDEAGKVTLQRDLSQAIAEYAPGSKVVVNKKEWESCGVKVMKDKALPVKHYSYDREHKFKWLKDGEITSSSRKYLCPIFGFAAPKRPQEPHGWTRQLYTTRPFFAGFETGDGPSPKKTLGITITKASPAKMVVLCEGKDRSGFYLCQTCGAGYTTHQKNGHKNMEGGTCNNATLKRFSLGHEFVTNVVQIQFPNIRDKEEAFSLSYAILLGAARALDVPDVDLNATITGLSDNTGFATILYDNVPGGAGLVDNLENIDILREALKQAKERVSGECDCDESCYGCLRSYRNQFAHPDLRRKIAYDRLSRILPA